ncbi:class I poly(R)-hydroxyalkanoic acid synthase [Methylocystis sp. JR02]|uniref:class I poly(R)-hydroxyalkanoic acid synthase n=1 Tax=Methylocystis sp. JR02 TaxID=3046284 RepID=UPI0024B8E246|nr:class I poly(R)-hydroxyalkanoic acid synthase [Methylocystis sp. JR02]MDJ0450535.1 class I poly(R)-hydroxyalkanoic acid synthase [Methylocystis sp. JR02]
MTVTRDEEPAVEGRKAPPGIEAASEATGRKKKSKKKGEKKAKAAAAKMRETAAEPAANAPRKERKAESRAAEAGAQSMLMPPIPSPLTSAELELMAENMAKLVDQGRKAIAAAIGNVDAGGPRSELAASVADATKTLGVVAEYWLAKPDRAAVAQAELYGGLSEIWRQTMRRYTGENVPPIVPPDPADKRFASPEWEQNPFFDWLRQSYLYTSRWAGEMVDKAEGLDPQTRAKAAFYTRLLASAVSPSNFVATNPELLRATIENKGENLIRGLKMFAEDINAGGGVLKIRQSDDSKFRLGIDLANTPGKVIWRNDVMELIQYSPTTEEVYARPLLLMPPWINKFYVLDLNKDKSFVRWAVEQGFTVFIISWVNPDESKAEKGFEAYMHEGILTALDVIEKATGERKVTAAGYCVGGTLLALTLAYMAATGDDRIESVTFFATQVDFSEAGDLQILIDEARMAALDEAMAKTGYLEGVKMANAFNMLRPNELIWTYVVNNYMKGVEPVAFDLLYWNSDSTRIPRANHSFYMRSCYLENRITRGEMVMSGVPINLRLVKIPVYSVATKEDHIAPARSVFRGDKFFGGDVTYVLGGSGHIAGIINPPAKGKYGYMTGGPVKGGFDEWVAAAEEHPGSWWPHWLEWITAQAPRKVPAREPGGGKLEILCDAPGDYVRVKA